MFSRTLTWSENECLFWSKVISISLKTCRNSGSWKPLEFLSFIKKYVIIHLRDSHFPAGIQKVFNVSAALRHAKLGLQVLDAQKTEREKSHVSTLQSKDSNLEWMFTIDDSETHHCWGWHVDTGNWTRSNVIH